MQWHEWQTIEQCYGLTLELLEHQLVNGQIKKQTRQNQQRLMSVYQQALSEKLWLNAGRPYYNVHPNIIGAIIRTNLSKIPCNQLAMPAELDVVHIRFSKDKHANELGEIQSILMSQLSPNTLDFHILTNQIFMGKPCIHSVSIINTNEDSIADTIERYANNLQESVDYYGGVQSLDKIIQAIKDTIKIAIICRFIHDCNEEELIQFDVLNKYKEQYVHADQLRRVELVNKTIRRGKKGWNIGTSNLTYQGEYGYRSKEHESTGRELSSAHIRSGHLHIVRCGEGKRGIRVKFFRPTVIRPDLPFKTT